MRKLIARVFDYSLDGLVADEGTEYFQFCRDLPDDEAQLEIDKLRRGGDGHIMVSGGVSFWRSLVRLDLIDEFRLDLRPYVAGEGTRLFDDVPKSYQLDLVSSTEATEPSGCTTAGTARPAADMHDEWQSGERHYLSEGSIVISDSLRRW